jgi:hypothetical protein
MGVGLFDVKERHEKPVLVIGSGDLFNNTAGYLGCIVCAAAAPESRLLFANEVL